MCLQTCASAQDTSHREEFIPDTQSKPTPFSVWNHCPLSYHYQKSLPLLFISPLRHWKAAVRSSRAAFSPGYWARLLEGAKMWWSQERYKNQMKPELMGGWVSRNIYCWLKTFRQKLFTQDVKAKRNDSRRQKKIYFGSWMIIVFGENQHSCLTAESLASKFTDFTSALDLGGVCEYHMQNSILREENSCHFSLHESSMWEDKLLMHWKLIMPLKINSIISYLLSVCCFFLPHRINLYELIKKNNFQGFSLSLIRHFTRCVLRCLQVLYQERIIHCDLKPVSTIISSAGILYRINEVILVFIDWEELSGETLKPRSCNLFQIMFMLQSPDYYHWFSSFTEALNESICFPKYMQIWIKIT